MENNGRKADGTFARGLWKGGPGRPRRATEASYLAVLRECVPLAKWRKIIRRAVADALDGDHKAREWLAAYLLGKPAEASAILADAEAANQPAPKVVVLDWRRKYDADYLAAIENDLESNGETHEQN
jgi:hypothetical protein